MKKWLGMIKNRRSLVLSSAFAPMCLGALVVGMGPSQLQDVGKRVKAVSPEEIKIVNKTTTLAATFEITANNHLLIKLRNLSSKNLNGYVVGITNQVTITTDLSSGDRFISPGQTDDLKLPLDSSSTEIIILAAMFTDGSIEGEPGITGEIRQWRLGLKEELARHLPALGVMLESSDTSLALDSLTVQSDDPEVVQAGKASGARSAKKSLNAEIELLRKRVHGHGIFTQKEGLLDLKRRIERRIASL